MRRRSRRRLLMSPCRPRLSSTELLRHRPRLHPRLRRRWSVAARLRLRLPRSVAVRPAVEPVAVVAPLVVVRVELVAPAAVELRVPVAVVVPLAAVRAAPVVPVVLVVEVPRAAVLQAAVLQVAVLLFRLEESSRVAVRPVRRWNSRWRRRRWRLLPLPSRWLSRRSRLPLRR